MDRFRESKNIHRRYAFQIVLWVGGATGSLGGHALLQAAAILQPLQDQSRSQADEIC